MLFMFLCRDRADAGDLRLANRALHLAHLEALGARVFAAGPLLGEDGATMIGSLLIIDCADLAAARALADNDPYAKAGLFAEVEIRLWRRVLPRA